jgi:hypothetical protein
VRSGNFWRRVYTAHSSSLRFAALKLCRARPWRHRSCRQCRICVAISRDYLSLASPSDGTICRRRRHQSGPSSASAAISRDRGQDEVADEQVAEAVRIHLCCYCCSCYVVFSLCFSCADALLLIDMEWRSFSSADDDRSPTTTPLTAQVIFWQCP